MTGKIIFISRGVSDGILHCLSREGAVVVRLASFSRIAPPVSSHADMLLFPLRDGRLLTYRSYYDENEDLLAPFYGRLAFTDRLPQSVYPRDIALNALKLGGRIYGLTEALDEGVPGDGFPVTRVAQGYTRCSCAVLSPRAVITSDGGLARALRSDGVDVLTVTPGRISLPGYDTGFIGGCGGLLREGEYVFFGDPLSHPDGEAMLAFAAFHGVRVTVAGDGCLTDLGGFVTADK